MARHPDGDSFVVEMLQLMAVIGRKKAIPPAIAGSFEANLQSVFFMANAGDLANFVKDFETATRCYDRMFALKPELVSELRNNKAVKKAYKKSRTSLSGRWPRIVEDRVPTGSGSTKTPVCEVSRICHCPSGRRQEQLEDLRFGLIYPIGMSE